MKKITEEQKKAIETIKGTVCVKAGAGTGKTTVLVERFLKIYSQLKKEGKDDDKAIESILAVTFTNKAAREMKNRIEDEFSRISPDSSGVILNKLWVSTIDSFCSRLLRENALELGIDPEFRILDEVENKLFFMKASKRIFNHKGLPGVIIDKSIDSFIDDVYGYIIQLRNNAVSARDFILLQKKISEEDRNLGGLIGRIYSLYEQEMRDKNLFSFQGLLLETLMMLTENNPVKDRYSRQFEYVLVDEYQDTTPLQHKLLRMFSHNFFVVGDVKQSIYAFRGARPENMKNIENENSVSISLTENFRSYDRILKVVNKAPGEYMPDYEPISSNKKSKGSCCEIFLGETREDEAEFIARRILELHRDKKISKLNDIAILLRSVVTPVSTYENALRRRGIPFVTSGGSGYFNRPEIKDILAYLCVINNPFDDLSLVRALRSPIYRIKNSVLAQLAGSNVEEETDDEEKRSYRKHLPLYDALSRFTEKDFSDDVKSTLAEAKMFIDDFLSAKRTSTLSLLVYRVITRSNYLHFCNSLPVGERKRSLANIRKLYALVQKFEERNIFSTLDDFIAYLREVTGQEAVESEARLSEENAVHIMSIHKAKGLEYPVVFAADIRERSFPSGGRSPVYTFDPENIIAQKDRQRKPPRGGETNSEEVRLLYVAMTRAKERLVLSGSKAGNKKISKFMEMFIGKDHKLLPELAGLIDDARKNFKKEDKSWQGRRYQQPAAGGASPVSIKQIEESLFSSYKAPECLKMPPKHFSVSELALYERCPLKYKYRYVFNLPYDSGMPGEPEDKPLMENYTFGSIMHMILEQWLADAGKNNPWDDRMMKEKFCELAVAYGKGQKEGEEIYEKEAKDILSNFTGNKNNNPKNVVFLEQPFSLFIDGWEVRGTIDRIDKTDGGYRIIDYKTGRKKEEKFQLTVYKWGAEKLLGCNPVRMLSLWFLRSNEVMNIDISQKDEKDTESKIRKIIGRINNREFNPAESEDACRFCEYKLTCEK